MQDRADAELSLPGQKLRVLPPMSPVREETGRELEELLEEEEARLNRELKELEERELEDRE